MKPIKKYVLFTIILFISFISNSFCQSTTELVHNGFNSYYNGNYDGAINDFSNALQKQTGDLDLYDPESEKEGLDATSNESLVGDDANNEKYDEDTKKSYTDASTEKYVNYQFKKYVNDPLRYQGDESAKIYLYRGWMYYKSGNKKAAISDFDKAVAIDSNLSEVYFRSALIAHDVNPKKVCPNLLKAVKQGHKSAEQLYNLLCSNN